MTPHDHLRAPVWLTAALLAGYSLMSAAADGRVRARDSVVDPAALNVAKGPFGSCFNGQTFQQEAVLSFNGYQYAAYYAHGGALCLARRKLDDGPWLALRFEDYRIAHNDVHNVAVLGICAGDGTVHLAYDHHVSPLHYRRSVPGLALRPDEIAWSTNAFGPTTSRLWSRPLSGVTYPQFCSTPAGDLLLLYRLGSSGDGDWHLAEYSGRGGKWADLGMLFTRRGDYATSRSRCAYPNPVRCGPDGRLHVTWCWRERPANGVRDLRTNHDVCYAFSDDRGRTWRNSGGQLVASLGDATEAKPTAIGVATPGTVVRSTRFLWGQMNTTTECVGPSGRVHVITWQQRQDAKEPSADLNTWRYYHDWRDADGTWHTRELPFVGRKPQIAVDDTENAYVLYGESGNRNYHNADPGWKMVLVKSTCAGEWMDWQRLWSSDATFVGEPLLDPSRWKKEGILSCYAQEKSAEPGAPSALHVIDLDVATLAP
ncbi:MAG TPA: BNR repeat-containing protein [Verrucomicrobiae bacterium]|nr:BNR repeat-containing protein [Verrucomicrobiae bacterium]